MGSLLLWVLLGSAIGASTSVARGDEVVLRPFTRSAPPATAARGAQALLVDEDQLVIMRASTSVRLEQFPLDEERTVELELTRFNVSAPQQRAIVVEAAGIELPGRSGLANLWRGSVVGAAASSVFLSESSAGLFGWIDVGDAESEWIISSGDPRGDRVPLVYARSGAASASINLLAFECHAEELAALHFDRGAPTGGLAGSDCHVIELALDTDEAFLGRFGGNLAQAESYLETLVGAASEIYERDFDVQFRIVFTRLWRSTDPWTAGSVSDLLNQVQEHWVDLMGGVDRDVVHMLAGTALGGGIAFRGVLCSEQFGYAVSTGIQGFFPYPLVDHHPQNWDINVFSHETGHILGSIHTHEYCPPIDKCAPAGFFGRCQDEFVCSQGTIMSYCHTCSPGMANIALEFHELVQADVRSALLGAPCLSSDCEEESCPGDFDHNGIVDGADLNFLLGFWGASEADLDGNDMTDGADLNILLGFWGLCS